MAIKAEELRRHILDFNNVTKRSTTKFTCPITFRECNPVELIDGHIINRAINGAPKGTVIQYKKIDEFYGSRVESSFVKWLNLPQMEDVEILKSVQELKVTFEDGSEATAFSGDKKAALKFPQIHLHRGGATIASLFVKIPMNDPRLTGGEIRVSRTDRWIPAHFVASMIKAGYLATFNMLGYSAVYCPWGDTVRRDLNEFYQRNGKAADAPDYFRAYRNSVKLLFQETGPDQWRGLGNTITDRSALLHFTPSETMFAATYFFPISKVTIAVTLPQGLETGDPAIVIEYYNRLMADDPNSHFGRLAKFNGNAWLIEKSRRQVKYPNDLPISLRGWGAKK